MDEKKVRNLLLEIERKHYQFFKENERSIVDYITIFWNDPVSIRVNDRRLPFMISLDIQEVFEMED
ncbi:hypothetical protein [Mucilaginibacter arboris]|uniref:Uncharacterized protein n=1 Tax=Mucilaginibacter arboris TaxID=2682090 RepID=A0A7K1T1Y8_9SPHI|nr:hypothetical protein [Mucilaginibacter arboris]MVN23537.1 hypothetical protein [Mucilaginibacter arboris]